MDIDLETTPFSCSGSWMSLSLPGDPYRPLGPGLYLRSHHSRPLAPREVLLVQLERAGVVLPSKATASSGQLTLQADDGSATARFAFDGPDDLVVEVSGATLLLRCAFGGPTDPAAAAHFSAYRETPDRVTINARPALCRFAVSALDGTVHIDAPWDGESCAYCDVRLQGAEGGVGRGRLAEYQSTWQPRPRVDVETAVSTQQVAFDAFAGAWGSGDVERQAAYILWSCTVRPHGLMQRAGILMSHNWMDAIWSWDNLFNCLAVSHADPDLAADQYLLMADHQDEHGAYPDQLSDGFKHYNYSKPPVQGALFTWHERRHPTFWNRDRRQVFYDTCAAFTRWWLNHRFSADHGLCYYLHGNDSGWDNGSLLREGAPLLAPDLNAFLVTQCDWLAASAEKLGYGAEAAFWHQTSENLVRAMSAVLWVEGEFAGLHLPTGALVKAQSLVSMMPALLGDRLTQEQRAFCTDRAQRNLTDWGPATEDPQSPHYISDGYWRGPIWAPSTMLAVMGLEAIGAGDLAAECAKRFCKLCAQSGFAENFDALTGAPLRDKAYTWTPSVYLELLAVYG